MATLSWSGQQHFVQSVVLIVLTSFFVLLRFAIKIGRLQALQGPDWLCLLATALLNVSAGLVINFIFNVSPSHSFDLDPSLGLVEISNLAKLDYANEILFGFGITAIKLSILWFYYILFSVDNSLRWVIRAAAIVSILWLIVSTLVVVLQCIPPKAYWETLASTEYCLEYPRILLGYELTNLFVDVAILCIPTGTVWNLQLSKSRKIPIMGIFLLGSVVCIISILRIIAIWHPPDIVLHFDFGRTYSFSGLQLGLAIITSCLPTLGPLLVFLSRPMSYVSSWYRSLVSFSSRTAPIIRVVPRRLTPLIMSGLGP
ncbi:hypothetical protein HD806DRAFT_512286 [Xylariaceae sp. AK1471]|nr:hypothetical protein HD806DRAFT_512286 [Xylariaceae sp. AK1471]